MANRTFAQNRYSSEKDLVTLYVAVAFNATSAPSLLLCDRSTGKYTVAPSAGDGFAVSFTRTGVGLYTLTLKDTYVRVLSAFPTFISNTNAVAPFAQVSVASDPTAAQAFGSAVGAGAVRSGTPQVKFVFFSAANTPADPAATEMAVIELTLQNSTAR